MLYIGRYLANFQLVQWFPSLLSCSFGFSFWGTDSVTGSCPRVREPSFHYDNHVQSMMYDPLP